MKKTQKRVLTVQDVSCFGKCSITVALPIISAAGMECTIMPDALLSAHTGIEGFTFKKLTDQMVPILAHWKKLGLRFDCIYTGFLCDAEQADICCDIVDSLRSEVGTVVVDPAMADNGELYPVFGPDFPKAMRRLCSKADVIKPNITEACMMLGRRFEKGPYTREWVEDLLEEAGRIGAGKVVLTGVYFDDREIGAAAYDCASGRVTYHMSRKVPGYYVGTGDIFSSALVSALMRGKSLEEATDIAVDLTGGSIRRTYEAGTDPLYGVDFEDGLPDFERRIGSGE